MAPQVGFEPTTLRLTAESECEAMRRCAYKSVKNERLLQVSTPRVRTTSEENSSEEVTTAATSTMAADLLLPKPRRRFIDKNGVIDRFPKHSDRGSRQVARAGQPKASSISATSTEPSQWSNKAEAVLA